jgi:tetratricopeptide (TPR) repeat protein
MATAIELYRKAYDLDYRKGDWHSAEELYKEIIEKFPYSDEKEYSLVHIERLEKLKANPRDQKLQPVRGSSQAVNGFNIVNFFLILLCMAALSIGGYFIRLHNNRYTYYELLLAGVSSERAGNYTQAQNLYKQAQKSMPAQPLAYRLLAELYLSRTQFQLAEIESKRWELARHDAQAVGEFRMRLKAAMQNTVEQQP